MEASLRLSRASPLVEGDLLSEGLGEVEREFGSLSIGADSESLDGLASSGSALGVSDSEGGLIDRWGADESASLISGGGLEDALGMGGDTIWDISGAGSGFAVWGAEISGESLNLDLLFIGHTSVCWVSVMGGSGDGNEGVSELHILSFICN